jgi:hypothetical protein
MLWRAKFDTWEPGSCVLPGLVALSLEGERLVLSPGVILVGGFDPRAQGETGVWSRLISEGGFEQRLRTLYLGEPRIHSAVRALTPKSKWATTFVGSSTPDWDALILPDRPERSFAGVVRVGTLDPLMIGLPTEEAWDRFSASLL